MFSIWLYFLSAILSWLTSATKKGKVYTARKMRDIIKMTEQVASSAIPKHCKK